MRHPYPYSIAVGVRAWNKLRQERHGDQLCRYGRGRALN